MQHYIIAGTNHGIFALNPENKQRLKLRLPKDNSRVLGVHANDSGVYHASEVRKRESKIVKGYPKGFYVNFVQISDSISGRPFLTITPSGSEGLPLEKRLVDLDFEFIRKDDSLLYSLNGSEGVIFEQSNEIEQSGKTTTEGRKVYFDGRRISTLDENVQYVQEVNAKQFQRAFRKKNRHRYNKNKEFF